MIERSGPLSGVPFRLRRGVIGGLVLICALAMIAGCGRDRRADVEGDEVQFLYDLAEYELAETSIKRQLGNSLAQQDVELEGFWLGLRPVADGPSELNADVDARITLIQAEEVSRLAAEVVLERLPRHDSVQVRVFWWSDVPGETYAQLGGMWTWDARGELIRYQSPEDLQRGRFRLPFRR